MMTTSHAVTRMLHALPRCSGARCWMTTSPGRRAEPDGPLPARKPVGAFRGGLFGFLLGSSLAGAGISYYIMDEYKVSNELLTEDIYSLQASVDRVHEYLRTLEQRLAELEKRNK